MANNTDRLKCKNCRTINLADQSGKKGPESKVCANKPPCPRVYEMPIQAACIKVCNKFEKPPCTPPSVTRPYYAHGKLMYLVKAALLVGSAYFTYSQGVWGDQEEVVECVRRWQEYMRSLNRRRPPEFDPCGKVIVAESSESLIGPIYNAYKELITTCFTGIVKMPLVVKCAYIDYLKALERRQAEIERENLMKKAAAK